MSTFRTTASLVRDKRRAKNTREDAYVALPRDDDYHMSGYEMNDAEKALESAVREALMDTAHPKGVAMNRALVTLTVFKFVPHPRVGRSFKVDCTTRRDHRALWSFKTLLDGIS